MVKKKDLENNSKKRNRKNLMVAGLVIFIIIGIYIISIVRMGA